MLDNDADAGALRTRAELDLGALGQGRLGKRESPVEAGEISLAKLVCLGVTNTRRDRLAEALEAGYLLGLRGNLLVA